MSQGPTVAGRAAAVCCYLLPNPLKGAFARNRGEFVQHHFRQAVGVSCMAVALVLLLVVLVFFSTGFWLWFERRAAGSHWLRNSAGLRTYPRSKPGPPPILASMRWNLPIFFIICCIWPNLLSIVLSSVTVTPLPFAIR